MPNDTRTGLKISGNRSYGVLNPLQRPDINIVEAVWNHIDKKTGQKPDNIQRRALGCPLRSLENYS